jgi:uncharacterized protein YlzI (FlbEa/FlbD family)
MIRLTKVRGHALYVNPEQVVEVGYDDEYKQTLVQTMAEGWYVTESPEEVARKVLEWKLAMINYGASYASLIREEGSTNYEVDAQRDMLKLLAGLEVEL